jgi:hypothetical protein
VTEGSVTRLLQRCCTSVRAQFMACTDLHGGEHGGEAGGGAPDGGPRIGRLVAALAEERRQRIVLVCGEGARVHLQILHVHLRAAEEVSNMSACNDVQYHMQVISSEQPHNMKG